MISKKRKILNLLVLIAILALVLLVPRYISNRRIINRYTMEHPKGIVDSNGYRQGEWITYDISGDLRLIENYFDNNLHGVRKVYYDNGVLRVCKKIITMAFKLDCN